MTKPQRNFTIAILAVLLLIVGMAFWGPSESPATQTPLVKLATRNFKDFESAFDAAADSPRLLLLLSPT
jgi:hypothetical protein